MVVWNQTGKSWTDHNLRPPTKVVKAKKAAVILRRFFLTTAFPGVQLAVKPAIEIALVCGLSPQTCMRKLWRMCT